MKPESDRYALSLTGNLYPSCPANQNVYLCLQGQRASASSPTMLSLILNYTGGISTLCAKYDGAFGVTAPCMLGNADGSSTTLTVATASTSGSPFWTPSSGRQYYLGFWEKKHGPTGALDCCL